MRDLIRNIACIISLLWILPLAAAGQSASVIMNLSGLDQPGDVVLSADGRIYVLEGAANRIRIYSAQGHYLGPIPREDKPLYQLQLPTAMAIDDRHLYVADSGNHRIAIFDLQGGWVKQIRLDHLPAAATTQRLQKPQPTGIAVDGDIIYWSDRANHQVCLSHRLSAETLRCQGQRGATKKDFQFPFHLALDADGYLHVVDVLNARIAIYHRKGRFFSTVSRFGLNDGYLYRPNGLAFATDGRLFISDNYRGLVSIFKNGKFMGHVSSDGINARRFDAPVGLYWQNQRLYVAEALGGRVQVITSAADDFGVTTSADNNTASAGSSRQQCVMCHLSWATGYRAGEGIQDSVQPVSSQRMCYSCHHGAVIESRTRIAQGHQHPDIHHQPPQTQKQTANSQTRVADKFPLLAGDRLYCGSCHTPHQAKAADIPDNFDSYHQNTWMRVSNQDGKLCQQCHEDKLADPHNPQHPVNGNNHPVGISMKAPPRLNAKGYARQESLQKGLPEPLKTAGAHSGENDRLQCQSCHQVHGGEGEDLLINGFVSSDLCASCHQHENSRNKAEARRKGIHPVNLELDKTRSVGNRKINTLDCASCHFVHDGRLDSALISSAIEDTEQLCQSCHPRHFADDEKAARQKGVHVVNIELEEPVTIAGEELSRIGCLSCHSMHQGKPDTPALKVEHRNGQLCKSCHQNALAVINSDHDLRITARHDINRLGQLPQQAGVCGSCHSMHRANSQQAFLSAIAGYSVSGDDQDFSPRDALCLSCHRAKGMAGDAVIAHYTHPWKTLVLRADPQTMPLQDAQGKTQEFGMIACITCHDPHRWAPAQGEHKAVQKFAEGKNRQGSVLNSFLKNNQLKGSFCVDCHGIETLVKFKYYHDDRAARIFHENPDFPRRDFCPCRSNR